MKTATKRSGTTGRVLKRSRVTAALLMLTLLSLVFLDLHGDIPEGIKDAGLYFQLVPSAILAFGGESGLGLAATGCLVVLVLTALFGRIYCSALCPLGISMDVAAAARLRPADRNAHRHAKGHFGLQLTFLCLALLPLAFGNLALVNLLDPYSTFGRLAAALARPVVVLGNNASGWLLEHMGSYAILPIPFKGVPVAMLVYGISLFLILVWLARKRGRFYCNTICPVGALLGLVSRRALVKIRLDRETCVECGRCEKVCKSECIDIPTGSVDSARCVDCFNCLAVCPTNAISFSRTPPPREAKPAPADTSRRTFMLSTAVAFSLLPATSFARAPIKITIPSKIPLPKRPHPILPPGSLGLDHFVHRCTACHACVTACPSQVLQPSLTGYGLDGLFLPCIDPDAGFCNLKCNACGEACPTGAIKPFSLEEKQTMQMGVVKFVRDNCIVVLQGTACGACSEHCPTKAVTMIDESGKMVPKVDPSICLGCGACEHVCPARPHKAIYVHPHTVHQTAKRPETTSPQTDKDMQGIEEFPF